jgi:hypothetical protein
MSLIPYITGINPYPILYPLIPLYPFATVIRHRHLQKILQKFFYIFSESILHISITKKSCTEISI